MIFLDTSALIAVIDRRDSHHRHALDVWEELLRVGQRMLLTDLVFAEIAVLLRRRTNHKLAVEAGDLLLSSALVELVYADQPLIQDGWALFRRYRDHEFSLTDCVSVALMRKRRIRTAFAFDADFDVFGFERL